MSGLTTTCRRRFSRVMAMNLMPMPRGAAASTGPPPKLANCALLETQPGHLIGPAAHVDDLRFDAVFFEEAPFLCDPIRQSIGADGRLGDPYRSTGSGAKLAWT